MSKNPEPTYARLLKKPWYRGTDIHGGGMQRLFAGDGFYLLWDESIAYMMAVYNGWKNRLPAVLTTWEIDPNIRLVNIKSREYRDARRFVQRQAMTDVSSPIYQQAINAYLKQQGYDGIISTLRVQGMLLFDESRAIPSDEVNLGFFADLPNGWEWSLVK